MEITGDVVLWVFGIVLGVIGALIIIIWNMLQKQIDAIMESAKEDRSKYSGTVERIYTKLDEVKEDVDQLIGEKKARDRE